MADLHTTNVLGKELYVIVTTPAAPGEEIMKKLPDHLARQIELEKAGILFAAGPMFDAGSEAPAAGLIIIRAANFEEADKIAAADPLHAAGLRTYTLRRWKLNEGSFTVTLNYSDQTMTVG